MSFFQGCAGNGFFSSLRPPKNMICHYFIQEGGGSSLDQLVIIYVVIIGLRGEGVKPNLQVFTKYAVFFFLKAPLRYQFSETSVCHCSFHIFAQL